MKRVRVLLGAIFFLHVAYAVALGLTWRYWFVVDSEAPTVSIRDVMTCAYLICLTVLLLLWCRTDAKNRSIKPPRFAEILVPLLFPIGVPYYFLRTYAPARAFVHIGFAAAFAALCFLVARWLANGIIGHQLLAA